MAQGREKTTDATDPSEIEKIRELEGADLKETFEIGLEGVEGLPNHWPDRFDGEGEAFKGTMLEFFELCKGLHVQVMRAIAVALGIGEGWFDGFCDGGDNTLRLLHYPEVSSKVFEANRNQVRAGAHTDYGMLIWYPRVMGLELMSNRLHYATLPGQSGWTAGSVA